MIPKFSTQTRRKDDKIIGIVSISVIDIYRCSEYRYHNNVQSCMSLHFLAKFLPIVCLPLVSNLNLVNFKKNYDKFNTKFACSSIGKLNIS